MWQDFLEIIRRKLDLFQECLSMKTLIFPTKLEGWESRSADFSFLIRWQYLMSVSTELSQLCEWELWRRREATKAVQRHLYILYIGTMQNTIYVHYTRCICQRVCPFTFQISKQPASFKMCHMTRTHCARLPSKLTADGSSPCVQGCRPYQMSSRIISHVFPLIPPSSHFSERNGRLPS